MSLLIFICEELLVTSKTEGGVQVELIPSKDPRGTSLHPQLSKQMHSKNHSLNDPSFKMQKYLIVMTDIHKSG